MIVDADVRSGRRAGGHRVAEPGQRPVCPAHTGVQGWPAMASGAVIPRSQTASRSSWTTVREREQADHAARADWRQQQRGRVGPADSLAGTLQGNGQNLNDTVQQLAAAAGTLSNSKDDLFATVDNLGKFTQALANSDSAVHSFYGKLADVSTFLADDRQDVANALSSLAVALGDVKTFIGENKDLLADNVQKLTGVTKALVDHGRRSPRSWTWLRSAPPT